MGGGVMRAAAAAKVAGVGISHFAAGIRRGGPLATAECSFASAPARKAASRPVSALVSSSSSPAETEAAAASAVTLPAPVWDAEDWEFAGGSEDEFCGSDSEILTPRLIFGPVPTLEEAKSATCEVKDALENAISPPNIFGCRRPLLTDTSDVITCNDSENLVAPAQNNAIRAFKLLKEPATQTVVASIVSDINVWNAVMQNGALTEYIESQKTNTSDSDINGGSKSAFYAEDSWFARVARETGNMFMGFMQNVNHTLVEMVNKASDFARDIFKGGRESENSEHSARESFMGGPLGATIMALAVSVIMVVVLRRG